MDIQNTISKIQASALNNATILAALAAFLGRMSESNIPIEEAIKFIPYEIQKSFASIDDLTWKLYRAPHVGQSIFKLSAIVFALGQFLDVVPKQYVNAAGKAMLGSAIGNIAIRGSTPTSSYSNGNGASVSAVELWRKYAK